jgi:hypothetical protein
MSLSPEWTAASGRLADWIYSRNAAAPYRRPYVVPVPSGSTWEATTRGFFTAASNAWKNTLSLASRDRWEAVARQNPTTDSLGQTVVLTGRHYYIGIRVQRSLANLTTPATPPLNAPGPGLTELTFLFTSETTLRVSFASTDPWTASPSAFINLSISPNLSLGRHFHATPFRNIGVIRKPSPFVPIVNPAMIVLSVPVPVDTRVFVKVICQNQHCKRSPTRVYKLTHVAPPP